MLAKAKKRGSTEFKRVPLREDPQTRLNDAMKEPMLEPRIFPFSPTDSLPVPFPPIQKTDGRYSIGQAIRLLRKEKGISQEELAKKARVDRTTIARVECGIFKSLCVEKLEGVAEAIGIDLKTLLIRASSIGESMSYRGHLSRIEFALEYPEDGFRIISHIPRRKEFFFGKIEIQPQKTIPSTKLPHPEQIYLHSLEGKILLNRERRESLLKPGECLAFAGFPEYEIYNPDPFKGASALFITYPSFLAA